MAKKQNKTKMMRRQSRASASGAFLSTGFKKNKTSEVALYFHQAQVSVGTNFYGLLLFELSYSTTCCKRFHRPTFFLYDAVKL